MLPSILLFTGIALFTIVLVFGVLDPFERMRNTTDPVLLYRYWEKINVSIAILVFLAVLYVAVYFTFTNNIEL